MGFVVAAGHGQRGAVTADVGIGDVAGNLAGFGDSGAERQQQALAIGLCDEVVRPSECEFAVQAMLKSVLDGSPRALAETKQFLNSLGDTDLREALHRAIQISANARASPDAREGLEAFLNKRKPAWSSQDDL